MPLILNLETSTEVCSVALFDGKTLLAADGIHEPQAHAARLAPLIDSVCRSGGVAPGDFDAVAVSAGPGSYTGLRIGVSTAKGLCYSLDVPLIAVGTLELLAFQGSSYNSVNGLLCPMIDARRMEVYCMVTDAQLNIVQPVAAKIIDQDSFSELLGQGSVLFFGNGANKCRQAITHPNAHFLDDVYPSAASLGFMAEKKFSTGSFEDLVHFKPFYLKEFVAKAPGAGRAGLG